jgi:hypothetical protein
MQLTMDTNELNFFRDGVNSYIKRFINLHQNSITDELLKNLEVWKNAPIDDRCSIINQLDWSSVAEGYYYCYFLQVRLAYGLAQLMYEREEYKLSRVCLMKADMFLDFCSSYNGYLGGTVKIDARGFQIQRKRYDKAINKLSRLLNEKSY